MVCVDGGFAIVTMHIISFLILGSQKIPMNSYQELWSSSGRSGRSMMSKIWSFRRFKPYWWCFCHYFPEHDTFLKFLKPVQYPGIFLRSFCHHQEDQEGQKCLKAWFLEDIRCFDGVLSLLPCTWYLFGILETSKIPLNIFREFL